MTPLDLSADDLVKFLRAQAERLTYHPRVPVGPDDVVSEAYLRIHRASTPFRGTTREEARAYLLTTLRRVHADLHTKYLHPNHPTELGDADLAGDPNGGGLAGALVAPDTSPSERASRRELEEWVEADLRNLPDHLQQVIRLKYLDGLSLTEVAERVGRPIATVAGWLQKALEMLQRSRPET
jgi:RNA polymerase sigma-70 factor (ECF subfamily)